jgi:hypothetical protein
MLNEGNQIQNFILCVCENLCDTFLLRFRFRFHNTAEMFNFFRCRKLIRENYSNFCPGYMGIWETPLGRLDWQQFRYIISLSLSNAVVNLTIEFGSASVSNVYPALAKHAESCGPCCIFGPDIF